MKHRPALITALLAIFVPTAPAASEVDPDSEFRIESAPDEAASSDSWIVQVTPYVWAAGVDGKVSPTPSAPTVHFKKSFSDVLDDFNIGGFVNLYGRKGRFVVSLDMMYVDLDQSAVIGALPIIGPVPGVGADVETRQFNATIEAGYRAVHGSSVTIDLLAGGRYFSIDNRVTLHAAGASISREQGLDWFEPVIGARAHFRLTDRLSLLAQGDVGGLGPSTTWQGLATLNYAFGRRVALSAGYKVLDIDYKSDGRVLDATLAGPVVGLTLRF